MADNRSLDEFVRPEEPGDPETTSAPTDTSDPTEGASDAEEPPSADSDPAAGSGTAHADGIEPIAETFAWSAAGGQCASCGETVEARWRDGDTLVCGSCKVW